MRRLASTEAFSELAVRTKFDCRIAQPIRGLPLEEIRAWRRYGMIAQQVADVYGAAVGEIERLLRTG
jgi:hypothetical protein